RGAFPVNGFVAPDPANGLVYFLNKPASSPTATIWACNSQTFVPVSFYQLAVNGSVSSFIRWGADGLAFRTSSNLVFLLRTSILHPYVPANPTLTTRPDGVRQLSLPVYDIVYIPPDHLIYT